MNPAEIPTGYEHTWHHSAFARQALAGVCRRQQLLSVDTPLTPARLAEHFSACWPWANPHQNERLDEFGGALRQSLPLYWSHCGLYRAVHAHLFGPVIDALSRVIEFSPVVVIQISPPG